VNDTLSLRDYVEHIYTELQSEIDRRYTAQEKAIEITAGTLKERLEGMNEFRSAISDTIANSVNRDAFDVQVRATEARFSGAEIRLERIETATREQVAVQSATQSRNALRVTIIGVIVVVAQIIIALLLSHHVI
jgi:hypothetical protein